MDNLGDFRISEPVFCFFHTSDSDGAAISWDSTPTIMIYNSDNTTEVGESSSAVTLYEDFDGKTGLHLIEVIPEDDSFFTKESTFTIVVSGTIDSVSVLAVLAQFSVEARFPYNPDEDEPTGDPANWTPMQKLLWLIWRFMNKHTSDNFSGIKVYKDDGTLATTQAVTEAGGVKTVNKVS